MRMQQIKHGGRRPRPSSAPTIIAAMLCVVALVAASLLLLVCIVGFVDCPRGLHRAKKKIAALEAERVIQE